MVHCFVEVGINNLFGKKDYKKQILKTRKRKQNGVNRSRLAGNFKIYTI